MTTEDDFQAKLDAAPDDWQTRLVLADWLSDRSDPRADGYRAMGHHKLRPYYDLWFNAGMAKWTRLAEVGDAADLWSDWYKLLAGYDTWSRPGTRRYRTRREAEDAAALAFSQLPAARRSELLVDRNS